MNAAGDEVVQRPPPASKPLVNCDRIEEWILREYEDRRTTGCVGALKGLGRSTRGGMGGIHPHDFAVCEDDRIFCLKQNE